MFEALDRPLAAKPREWYESMEKKIASVLIGTIMMLWSPLGIRVPTQGRGGVLYRALSSLGVNDEWFYAMFAVGLALVVGAIFPLRKLRHISHFLAMVLWLSTFGVVMMEGSLSLVMFTFLAFAAASFALLIADVRGKPRECSR